MFLEKVSKKDIVSLHLLINFIPLLKFRFFGSFPSDYVPTLDNDIFATKKTQLSKLQGEQWKMIANACQKLNFANIFGRKMYTFLKEQFEQMMPDTLQSHPRVCCFYTIYAAFHLFKFRQEEITGVHDVNVFSFMGNFYVIFQFFFRKCAGYTM